MTPPLANFQGDFFRALFDLESPFPLAAQPAFAVYRNTVIGGCIETLAANFPAVCHLVDDGRFRAAAAAHVAQHPPRDGRMLLYGEAFAAFLHDWPPARDLAWLADVARLDRFWIEAHTAPDASPADAAWLASIAPEALGELRLAPHIATRWRWFAEAPVFSIWSANRVEPHPVDSVGWQAEGALLARPQDAVIAHAASRLHCAFLDASEQGATLAEAAGATLEIRPDADIARVLADLLQWGALAAPTDNQEQ